MIKSRNYSEFSPQLEVGKVTIVEAAPLARQLILKQWLKTFQGKGVRTYFLSCDLHQNGIWAGLKDLLMVLLPEIREQAPELIDKHSYELTMVLPNLRREIVVRNPNLTDIATNDEQTRNYPVDRAYRILHGLINLLDSWFERINGFSWIVVCDDYDRSGLLVRRFFSEILRRRGKKLNLMLLVAVDPGKGAAIESHFPQQFLGQKIDLDLHPVAQPSIEPELMGQLALALEQQLGNDLIETEIHLPKLIYYWLHSDRPEQALIWQAKALGIYNHQGFYEDALVYSEAIAEKLDRLCGDNDFIRWNIVGNLFGCYVATGDMERAKQVIEVEAIGKINDPKQLVRVHYVMSMLHARYLLQKDFVKAADYLEQSLVMLPDLDLPEHEKYFLTAFTRNGLAFVRYRQGNITEAITLCHSASELLDAHLDPDRHSLHRSVLLYNIAQIYVATQVYTQAISYFTATMVIDPHYSEYYNERGNVYLKLEQYEEAIADYLKAIELSPPYEEVWSNLGLCYRLIGKMEESVRAYTIALDIQPNNIASLIGRAQAWEALEQVEAALLDYSLALDLNSEQPLLLANRASLYYETDRAKEALHDLNRAIVLAPNTADLYQNRAVVLMEEGKSAESAADFQTYLQLYPEAEDRVTIENTLSKLLGV